MSKNLNKQFKKKPAHSQKNEPILSLNNFDIYDNGTIKITNHPSQIVKESISQKTNEKINNEKKFEGIVDLSKVTKKDTKWFVIRDKKFGPYSKKQLIQYYRAKKIGKEENLEGNNTKEMTKMNILFAPKDKIKVPDTSAMRVLKLNIQMAISDGDLDEEEIKQLYDYCEEHKISKSLLYETLQFLNKDGPPPIDLINGDLTQDDFLKCVEMAKADGKVSSSEITLLKKMLRKLRKNHPELVNQKLKDFLTT